MNVRKAIDDTMLLVEFADCPEETPGELNKVHLHVMYSKIKNDFAMDEYKLNRWLGWMQAAVVSWGAAELADMIEINKRNQ